MAFMFGSALLPLALPAAALDWSHAACFSLDSNFEGPVARFNFTVTNTANGSLDVYFVKVHFCWLPPDTVYYLKQDDGTAVTIAGEASHDFPGTIAVNATALNSCTWVAQVKGKAIGDPSAYTATYRGSISANPPGASAAVAPRPGIPLVLLGGLVATAISVPWILVLLLRRRRPPQEHR